MKPGKTERFEPPVAENRREVEGLISRLSETVDSIQEFQATTDVSQSKKQLREVSRSIAKLQRTNVPAPDELRRLESALLSKLHDAEEIAGLLTFINQELGNLQTRLRGLRSDSSRDGIRNRRHPESGEEDLLREAHHDGRKRRFREFWERLLGLPEAQNPFHANLAPTERHWITLPSGFGGLIYAYGIFQHYGRVELYIDRGDLGANKRIFDELKSHQPGIERDFGAPLVWERLETKRACRISYNLTIGGYSDDEASWAETQTAMIAAMIGFTKAIAPIVAGLGLSKGKRPFPIL